MAYLVKRDHLALQVQREEEDHQGLLDLKGPKVGKVTEVCKELLDLQDHREKLEAQVIQDLLVPLVSLEQLV